jgi:hypothetical protein
MAAEMSVDMVMNLAEEEETMSEPKSAGGRALRGGAHELGVLGQNATGIARGKRGPAVTAGVQLSIVDE